MASDKPFNYHSGLWMLLNCIILSQTCSGIRNDSIEDSEVDNRLEKIHFADLVMQSQLQVFSPSCQFQVRWNDVTWEDKNSKLFGVTFSLNEQKGKFWKKISLQLDCRNILNYTCTCTCRKYNSNLLSEVFSQRLLPISFYLFSTPIKNKHKIIPSSPPPPPP